MGSLNHYLTMVMTSYGGPGGALGRGVQTGDPPPSSTSAGGRNEDGIISGLFVVLKMSHFLCG